MSIVLVLYLTYLENCVHSFFRKSFYVQVMSQLRIMNCIVFHLNASQ